jgi:pimeloyl-ACP methyl ester carboxylesterase
MLRAAGADTDLLLAAAEGLASFDRPALVVWASGDRVMPPEHGRRLAELLPHGRLVEIEDTYTLIPLDQPARLAQLVREFSPGR